MWMALPNYSLFSKNKLLFALQVVFQGTSSVQEYHEEEQYLEEEEEEEELPRMSAF